jgi:hypothetical protein
MLPSGIMAIAQLLNLSASQLRLFPLFSQESLDLFNVIRIKPRKTNMVILEIPLPRNKKIKKENNLKYHVMERY